MADKNRRDSSQRVLELLNEKDLRASISGLEEVGRRKAINVLQAYICSDRPETRWRAIAAMGALVAGLADDDIEAGREIMRRLIWNLNEESGNTAWGAPEAMAEIMARHRGLAQEFSHILVSYVMPGESFLEFEPLMRGVVWGIARLAETKPDLAQPAAPFITPLLQSRDPAVRGLAARALGLTREKRARDALTGLLNDDDRFETYTQNELTVLKVSEVAKEALNLMR